MNDRPEYSPLSAVLPRLYWLVFGNIILILVAVTTLFGSFENLLVASLVFWANVFCMVIVRYLDIRYFRGETVDFQTATMAHWKRYSASLIVGAMLAWALTLTIRLLLA